MIVRSLRGIRQIHAHFHSRSVFVAMREIRVKCISSESESESETVAESSSSLSVQFTPEIEKKFVHSVYDAIAPHFSSTRFAKWPKVSAFLSSLPRGSLVLDAGCGNGKYLGSNPNCVFLGCDISAPLVKICVELGGHEALVADAVNLPMRANFADAALSIAVLHHLSTERRRRRALEELVRAVKPGGLILVTVWAVEQEDQTLLAKWTPLPDQRYAGEWVGPGSPSERSGGAGSGSKLESIPESSASAQREGKEYFVPWHLPYHRAEVGGEASVSALADGLARKDDKKGALVYNRYYHVFTEGELERLVFGMENAVVVDRFFDKSNWCIILEKTS